MTGFWIFLAVVYAADSWLFSKGYETFFHTHKTEAEKELRDAAVAKRKQGGAS